MIECKPWENTCDEQKKFEKSLCVFRATKNEKELCPKTKLQLSSIFKAYTGY